MYLKLGKSTLAFINIIDLFSKYAYSKLFQVGRLSQAVKSNKSVLVFDEFMEVVKGYGFTVGMVVCDQGSEFMGTFITHLEELDIPQIFVDAGDKFRTSPIERFNRTLRTYLEKYRLVNGRVDNSVLNDLLVSYNNVPHSKLEHSPIDILTHKNTQNETMTGYLRDRTNFKIQALSVGTHVRILLTPATFQKITPVWSTEIYTITKVTNYTNYYVNGIGKYFKKEQLQVVNTDTLFN
jgi:hypothetical protein